MSIVGNAELVGDGQQQRVGLSDGLVLPELLDQNARLGSITAPENRFGPWVNKADLVIIFSTTPEIGTIAIVHDGDNAAADGHPWLALVARLLPGRAVGPYLGRLLDVERLACFVVLERRA